MIELSKLGERFENAAGVILNIIEGQPCGGVSLLWCKAGSSRSHHSHREDSHILTVVSGAMKYVEQKEGSEREQRLILPGEAVFTGPGTIHSTYYDVDTVLLSVSARSRTKAEHEADLVRCEPLPWVDE